MPDTQGQCTVAHDKMRQQVSVICTVDNCLLCITSKTTLKVTKQELLIFDCTDMLSNQKRKTLILIRKEHLSSFILLTFKSIRV